MDPAIHMYSASEVREIAAAWLSQSSAQAGEHDQRFLDVVRWATNKNDENFRTQLKLFTDTLFATAYDLAPQIGAATEAATFEDIEAFVIFVGYPATGHSLIGSMLDAHPDMAIAHELHVTEWIHAGISRHDLFAMLLRNSRCFARIDRYWNEHAYGIPGQWQGRTRKLRVIGDKKGAPTTLACIKDPQLLRKIAKLVNAPLKIIHAIRNPYDEIASRLRRYRLSDGGFSDPKEISEAIEWTAKLYAFNDKFLADASEYSTVYHLTHEELTENPSHSIGSIIDFLGLQADDDYLTSCAAIVNTAPDPARFKLEWTPAQIDRVAEIIDGLRLFRDYKYAAAD